MNIFGFPVWHGLVAVITQRMFDGLFWDEPPAKALTVWELVDNLGLLHLVKWLVALASPFALISLIVSSINFIWTTMAS